MADPRLSWRQLNVSSPNVSGLMRGANQALNNAASAAENILGRYEEGQMQKNDVEVANELAALDTQEEIDAYFANGGLNGRQVSDEIIQAALGRQGEVDSFANTRSTVRSRDGRLAIANDQNSRAWNQEKRTATVFGQKQEAYAHQQAQQDYLRENADDFVTARRGALTGGTAFSAAIDRTESGGGLDQYDTLYGHRNRNNNVRVSNMTIGQVKDFSDVNGQYGQSVNSEIGRVATPMGKFQIVGTTLKGIQKNLNLPDDIPFSPAVQEQMGLYLAQQRVFGPRSRASMRKGLRQEWEGFANKSDAELDVIIDEVRSMPAVTRESVINAGQGGGGQTPRQSGGPRQTTQTGFGGDAFTNEMASSGLFTPQEILGLVKPLEEAGNKGDQLIATEQNILQADIMASTLDRQIQSSANLTGSELVEAVREDLIKSGEFTDSEATKSALRAEKMLEESQALQTQLSPTVANDVQQQEIVENTIADERRRHLGQDQNRAINDIKGFEEDPSGKLASELGLEGSSSNFDPNEFRGTVNSLADEFNVEPAVMAVALRDAYERDPAFIKGQDTWHGLGWDLTRNTIENQFDRDAIQEAVDQLSPDARRDFERGESRLAIMEAELQGIRTQQETIRRRLSKTEPGTREHARLTEQLADLQIAMAKATNREPPQ